MNQRWTGLRAPAACAGLLTVLVLWAYRGVGELGFVFDDALFFRGNPFVARGLTAEGLRWALTANVAALWHPVTLLSHMLDVQLFGMRPGAHHVVNVLIHLANTLLLFEVLRGVTGALARSAFVAALFAVHPLHVESVAWIAERKDLLSTFFAFLALHAYRGYAGRRGARRYVAVALLFAASLACKPMLVTFPFLLLLLDHWPLRRFSGWPTLLEKAPLLGISAAASALALATQQDFGSISDRHPFPVRAANAAAAYLAYAGKALWPDGLAVLYPHPGSSLPAWRWIAGTALVALIAAAAIRCRHRLPWVTTGGLWFLGALVPVIGLVQVGVQAHADRYTYVPLVGLFLLVAWGLPPLFAAPAMRPVLRAASLAAVLACAGLTARQIPHWQNNRSLYEHALDVAPGSWLMHGNLIVEYLQVREYGRAVEHARELVGIRPDYPEAHFYLAHALERWGLAEEAVAEYRHALRLNPGLADAEKSLGLLLQRLGRSPAESPR